MRYLSAKKGGALVPAALRGQADVDRRLAWQLAHLGPAMNKVAFERIVKRLTGQGTPDEAPLRTRGVAGTASRPPLDASRKV